MELSDIYQLDEHTDRILVTCALPYVNNVPHLGNMVPLISADMYARFLKQRGLQAIYMCATDEHGTRTEMEAAKAGLDEDTYCKQIHARMEEVFGWFHVDFDYFGRTSAPENHELTQELFLKAHANGYVEEQEIEQLYSVQEQMFLPDTYVLGSCPYCGYDKAQGDQCDNCGRLLDPLELVNPRSKMMPEATIERRTTRHLYLCLDKLAPKLKDWIESNEHWTGIIRNMPLGWIEEGLKPRGITRDLDWGVRVPLEGYRDKVFYVWFDAPIGYIAATSAWAKQTGASLEDWWKGGKARLIHFLGKDNVPFHTLMWPGTLLAADDGWNLPTFIASNEYLTYEGDAFSKSRGVGVFSEDAMSLGIPADAWRFYIMANRPERRDFDFDFASFQALMASDLVGNLGNLVNRVLSFTAKRIGQVPAAGDLNELDRETMAAFEERRQEVERSFQLFELRQACRHILALGDIANRYVQASEPWHTIKADRARCETSLHLACEMVRQVAQLAWPVMPERMGLVLDTLGLSPTSGALKVGHALTAPPLLFEPIEDARVEELTRRYGAEQDSGELTFEKNPAVEWPCVILELSDLKIKRRIKSLRREIKEEVAAMDLDALMARPHVQAYQELLERYDQGQKHSVQNLADIVRREGKMPNINALVDVYNLYSLREGLVMGAYDRKAIRGKLLYEVATGQEHFYPVKGQDPEPIQPGEWVIKDAHDMVVTRVASKQAEAVAVSTDTQSCAMCIQGNPQTSLEDLQRVAEQMAAEIVERCGGQWRLVHAG